MKHAILLLSLLLPGPALLCGIDLSQSKAAFAHYTAWHVPENASHVVSRYYNYPLHRASGSAEEDRKAEIRQAMAQGIDGFFVDVVFHEGQPAHYVDNIASLLKAAEGTPFTVGPCLDRKTSIDHQVSELKTLLDNCAKHPNFPHWGNRPVLVTYTCLQWTPDEWREIRRRLKEAGYDIFLVGNFRFNFDQIDFEKLKTYRGVFDMAYSFAEAGLNGVPSGKSIAELRDFSEANGMKWMAPMWPGYYGGWMARNDFYQPFFGFDQLHDNFLAVDPARDRWMHFTTWNDHDESSLLPMAFTWGNAEITRAYTDAFKGVKPTGKEPSVLFSYHRETLPGTLLRIEALTLPVALDGKAAVSGRLLDAAGKPVCDLPEKQLQLDTFDRAEWFIPTAGLAASPLLIPEFTVKTARETETRELPAIVFSSSWLQNAVTVKVPFRDMLNFPNTFDVSEEGNLLSAKITFDAPEALEEAVLWRNDRPIAAFRPEESGKKRLDLAISPERGDYTLRIRNGEIRKAVRRFTDANDPTFQIGKDALRAAANRPWSDAGIRADAEPGAVVELETGTAKLAVPLAELLERESIKLGGLTLSLAATDPVFRNEPPLDLRKGELGLALWTRKARPGDWFQVRYTTRDGNVGWSRPLYPFAGTVRYPLAVLETQIDLDRSSGASGMPGRENALSGKRPAVTPTVRTVAIHPATIHEGRWRFEGNGKDELGNMPVDCDRFLSSGGINNSGGLKFDGKAGLKMRMRTWPIGSATIEFMVNPEPSKSERPQLLAGRTGWSSGLSIALRPDGRIEVLRDAGKHDPAVTLTGKTALPAGKWTRVRVTFNEKTLKLFIDGVLDAETAAPLMRSYGNSSWYLGGGLDKFDNFTGRIDDVTVLGIAAEPGASAFPELTEAKALPPLEATSKKKPAPKAAVLPKLEEIRTLSGWKTTEGKVTETADSLVFELGSGSRRALTELPDFTLADGQAVAVTLKRYDAAAPEGWQAVQVQLVNAKGHTAGFNLTAPDNLSVVTNLPKRDIRRGTVPLRTPAELVLLKEKGELRFYLDGKELFRCPDDAEYPFIRFRFNPIFQTEKDKATIEFSLPRLLRRID